MKICKYCRRELDAILEEHTLCNNCWEVARRLNHMEASTLLVMLADLKPHLAGAVVGIVAVKAEGK